MNINDLINKINESVESVDLVTARRLIEYNLELNRQMLKSNARSLFEILQDNKTTVNNLSRNEMNVIYAINSYATNFDLNGLKLSVKNNLELLMRENIKHYLNGDAKALLTGMKVLN